MKQGQKENVKGDNQFFRSRSFSLRPTILQNGVIYWTWATRNLTSQPWVNRLQGIHKKYTTLHRQAHVRDQITCWVNICYFSFVRDLWYDMAAPPQPKHYTKKHVFHFSVSCSITLDGIYINVYVYARERCCFCFKRGLRPLHHGHGMQLL